jgi:hypothetical protein
MALLDEKSAGIERLRRMRDQVSSAKGLRFEDSIGPQLDACFAPYGDELEATGRDNGRGRREDR